MLNIFKELNIAISEHWDVDILADKNNDAYRYLKLIDKTSENEQVCN